MLFRLLPDCGTHKQGGKTYKSGDVINTKTDLRTLFPNKFEAVSTAPVVNVVPPSADPVEEDAAEDDEEEAKEFVVPEGFTDVTAQFDEAEKSGLKVLKSPAGKFLVFNSEDNTTALNGDEGTTKPKAIQFIADYK